MISDADREFWAFQVLRRPSIPRSLQPPADSPIDAFVVDRLEDRGLSLAPMADRTTILLRASLDATGLPPTPDEVREFLRDDRPGAYDRLVDRLLASPHFGERWGRSWLDWAGYVDVYGKDNDFAIIKPLPGRWRYRDYVVQTFNVGKPFDRFLLEQLAGDELVDWRNAEAFTPRIVESLTATGFLLCSDDDTDQNELNTPDIRHHVLQQTGEIVASNLFALTVQCARCHNHKYEAISQLDYYGWLANFAPVFNPQRWVTSLEHGIPDVAEARHRAIDRHNAEIDSRLDARKKHREALSDQYRERFEQQRRAAIPEAIRTDLKAALETPAEDRTPVQAYLAEKLGPGPEMPLEKLAAALGAREAESLARVDAEIRSLEAAKQGYGTIQVAVEQNPPSPT